MIKRIWSYWEGSQPEIVKKSIESWKKYLPDWEIIVLDKESLKQYPIEKPASYETLTPTTRSDVIRLSLLFLYGGVWMDASIILLENFDWLDAYVEQPYYGFVWREQRKQFIESWFIFAPRPLEPTFNAWLATLNSILDTIPYDDHVAYTSPCTHDNSYFMIYQAFCYLVDTNPTFSETFKNISFGCTRKYMYNPLIPLKNHHRLIKFTKDGRTLLKYTPFPVMYIILVVFIYLSYFFIRRNKK